MISLKKYLDIPGTAGSESATRSVLSQLVDTCESVLMTIGRCAAQDGSPHGAELNQSLQRIAHRFTVDPSTEHVEHLGKQVELELQEWGSRAAADSKAKTEQVKELLLALAKTVEGVGSRDQSYTNRFSELTRQFAKIADLNDLSKIRTTLVSRVQELKSSVDQMTRESQQALTKLREEITSYETKLLSAESHALTDALTGIANRRNMEQRINRCILSRAKFSVVMLDINRFKPVNDIHGHQAGDDLLKQFAHRLKARTRCGDLAGRWGGDEFLVLMMCDEMAATGYIDRIKHVLFGNYKIRGINDEDEIAVYVDAAVGQAQWRPGESLRQVVERADAAMYAEKRATNKDMSMPVVRELQC